MSDHPTYPAKTGASGAILWIAVVVAAGLVVGCVLVLAGG
jgi:hypothetical protein